MKPRPAVSKGVSGKVFMALGGWYYSLGLFPPGTKQAICTGQLFIGLELHCSLVLKHSL